MVFRTDWSSGQSGHIDEHNLIGKRLNNAVSLSDFGSPGVGINNTQTFIDAIAAAPSKGAVIIPPGQWETDGVDLGDTDVTLQGYGDASIIKQRTGASGPVVDLTNYDSPADFQEIRELGNFTIRGNASSNNNIGLLVPNQAGLSFRNIGIFQTGGRCLDITDTLLCSFTNITLSTPIDAETDDVAYLYGQGQCNGNTLINVGIRGITGADDTGITGAVVLTDDGANVPSYNNFINCWVEYLHPPANGCIFNIKGNMNAFDNTQVWDSAPESATGTRIVKFGTPSVNSFGGNSWKGWLKPPQPTPYFEYGIELGQNGNFVMGYAHQGYVVTINTSITRSTVIILGVLSGSADPRVGGNGLNQPSNVIIESGINDSMMRMNGLYMADRVADPTAPAFNAGILYVKDNGSGKSQLCVLFPSGSAQVIATEP